MSAAELTDRDFRRFQQLIYESAGIRLGSTKQALLASRLQRRVRLLRFDCYGEYLDHVQRDGDELVRMLDCITTNETRFFREPLQFEFLHSTVIPAWTQEADEDRRPRAVRVWSAGCATGEEPYSLAMVLLESLPDWDVRIVATDLSTRALQVASEGVWPVERAASIPEPLLKRFMLRGHGSQQGRMKAGAEIRRIIEFSRFNLNDSDYTVAGPFDLILCRNVLIYFDVDSRRRVIERLVQRLDWRGYLFVGHAETLHGVNAGVKAVAPTMYRLAEPRSCTS